MGKASRDKGARGERELAALFTAALPGITARRGLQPQGGGIAPDVDNVPLVWVECKRGAKTVIRGALKQAVANAAGTSLLPVAATRDDGQEWLVTMALTDWLVLYRMAVRQDAADAAYAAGIVAELRARAV